MTDEREELKQEIDSLWKSRYRLNTLDSSLTPAHAAMILFADYDFNSEKYELISLIREARRIVATTPPGHYRTLEESAEELENLSIFRNCLDTKKKWDSSGKVWIMNLPRNVYEDKLTPIVNGYDKGDLELDLWSTTFDPNGDELNHMHHYPILGRKSMFASFDKDDKERANNENKKIYEERKRIWDIVLDHPYFGWDLVKDHPYFGGNLVKDQPFYRWSV